MAARKAHVYRVFQTDDQGNVVDADTWLDILRIDRFTISEPRGASSSADHLVRDYVFLWGDDTVDSWAMPPRELHKYTVAQLSDSSGNPDLTSPNVDIPLLERTSINFRGPQETGLEGDTHSSVLWVFINDGRAARKEKAIRVTNNDLNNAITMPVATVGQPQPPTGQGEQIAWADYAQALQDGTVDDSQFVDVQVTERFPARLPPPSFSGNIVTYVLVQIQQGNGPPGVLDLFKPPPGSGNGSGGGTIYRTDPLQTIVNVSWGGLAVEFGDGASGPPNGGGP